jgi:hypothetical protein
MPDYGQDLSCYIDINPTLMLVSGTELMRQVAFRRLYCRQGSLLSDPTAETLDVRDFMGMAVESGGLSKIQGLCQAALLADERIDSAIVQATFTNATRKLTLQIACTGSNGPFNLTLSVDALTVELLRAA